MKNTLHNRTEREQEFHNLRYAKGDTRKSINKIYAELEEPEKKMQELIRRQNPIKVLEVGCGPFIRDFLLRDQNSEITRIDISEVAIKRSNEMYKDIKNIKNIHADIHEYRTDDSYDVIVGYGVLHHLDLPRAAPAIAKLLEEDGLAVFLEPQKASPWVSLYRLLTPSKRSPDEKPFDKCDYATLKDYFEIKEIYYFYYIEPFLRMLKLPETLCIGIERIFKLILPKKWAWQVVLSLKRRSQTDI